jgi:alpha-tubulin suppressor-like RCC1 family protein
VLVVDAHSLATKTDGTLWAWGSNNLMDNLGQNNRTYCLITSTNTRNLMECNKCWWLSFSLATKTDGTLWSWGYNLIGELGQNNTTQSSHHQYKYQEPHGVL